MMLSVFSSIACRKYIAVPTEDWYIPLGILAVAEQPSSTGKSRVIGGAQKPFQKIVDDVKREIELGFKDESLSAVNTPIAVTDEIKHRLELPLALIGFRGDTQALLTP
ncbi:hypothetical protein V2P20_02755 [Methylobacter sp. Wu1]|uniref:hypothetical protein n=1 Tax=Methylobacter sp. Wu1 TaxID=3119359 RepID=UPI002F91E510